MLRRNRCMTRVWGEPQRNSFDHPSRLFTLLFLTTSNFHVLSSSSAAAAAAGLCHEVEKVAQQGPERYIKKTKDGEVIIEVSRDVEGTTVSSNAGAGGGDGERGTGR